MTKLTKPVRRKTTGTVFTSGEERPIVIKLVPPNILAFRAFGEKREYVLTAEQAYWEAVKRNVAAGKPKRVRKTAERGAI